MDFLSSVRFWTGLVSPQAEQGSCVDGSLAWHAWHTAFPSSARLATGLVSPQAEQGSLRQAGQVRAFVFRSRWTFLVCPQTWQGAYGISCLFGWEGLLLVRNLS